jgi:hypothetical protein
MPALAVFAVSPSRASREATAGLSAPTETACDRVRQPYGTPPARDPSDAPFGRAKPAPSGPPPSSAASSSSDRRTGQSGTEGAPGGPQSVPLRGGADALSHRLYSLHVCQTSPEQDRIGSSSTAMNVMNRLTSTYVGSERWQSSGSVRCRWRNREVFPLMSFVSWSAWWSRDSSSS